MFRICLAYALLAWGGVARAALLLNEVLYDPAGADAGAEFVEIYLADDHAVSLAGCRLVFLNGSDPSRPVTMWEAGSADRIEPASFFVIGGESVEPRHATANLSLQNGPDALQLWRDGVLLDAVAWGDVEGLGEGAPAVDVASTSLGRVPDGADTDDNAADWFELEDPNPGAPNWQPIRFTLQLAQVSPPWRLQEGPFTVHLHAVASGSNPRQHTRLGWWLDGDLVQDDELTAARGDTTRIATELALTLGRHRLLVSSETGDDTLAVVLHVGLTDVILSEILARPVSGAPEWIELRSLADEGRDVGGWAIADATRDPRRLPADARIEARGLAVLSQDCAALELVEHVPCWEVSRAWPTLNNTPSDGNWADEVHLLDATGAVVDWAPYDDRLQPGTGVSMERSVLAGRESAVWFASPGEPTPGRANLTANAPVPRAGLEVSPNPFSPDGDGHEDVLHVVLRLDPGLAVATAEIFDLAGEPVRELGEHDGGGLLQWIWDGRDRKGRPAPMGAYVVLVRTNTRATPWRALVALGRRS